MGTAQAIIDLPRQISSTSNRQLAIPYREIGHGD